MHHTVYAAGASKAVDVAIKSARRLTGRRKIVAIASGYRGRTGLSGAAVILETMPATYGFPLPSDGYLPGVPGLCREFGALYIADEVQTGLGRTGCVWGVDAWGVEPDILVTGKGQVMGLVFDAPAGGVQMMAALHRHGVWATFAGHDRPVLQFKPGLFVDRACCDEALTRFEAALRVARRQR